MTYYYVLYFHVAWIEVWFYSPNGIIQLTDTLICSNIEQNVIFNCLVSTVHSILELMQIPMLPLKLCVFSEQREKTTMKMVVTGDTSFYNVSIAVSSQSFIHNNFNGTASKNISDRTSEKPCMFPLHTDQINIILSFLRILSLSQIFEVPMVIPIASRPQETVQRTQHPNSQVGWGVSSGHPVGCRCLSSFR